MLSAQSLPTSLYARGPIAPVNYYPLVRRRRRRFEEDRGKLEMALQICPGPINYRRWLLIRDLAAQSRRRHRRRPFVSESEVAKTKGLTSSAKDCCPSREV